VYFDLPDMSTGKVGRPAQPIVYVDVHHSERDYVVGIINPEVTEAPLAFVFDKEVETSVKSRSWHKCSVNYIASTVKDPYGAQCQLFLHNLVMGKLTFNGKGQLETVDHINRNGYDNRRENLRIISQSEQNMNQRRRPRSAVLPADCGFTMEDVPRHIWYIKATGAHGDRFAIEFKSEGIVWKTTSSKKKTLRQKLDEALLRLTELYTIYPHLDPENTDRLDQERSLTASFNTIIHAAKQKIGLTTDNIVHV
jgi:hypothetical protein